MTITATHADLTPTASGTPGPPPRRSNHKRRDIQGLRAVAALLVVLYHLWPERLPGGYIGVDVFFVISGFLITSHLLAEIDARGRIQLGQFWARRARRLLPGAYLVLAATAYGIYRWVPQIHWPGFYREIVSSALYYENWSLAHDAVDYLAQENAPSPMQHYWTLSAEEQFYLIWPLLILVGLALAARIAVRAQTGVAIVLSLTVVVSLAFSLYLTAADPARAFFVTPTRAWEFGFGALLAFVPVARLTRLPRLLRQVVSWLALAVILGAGFALSHTTPMPGTAALIVVTAVVAFLAVGRPSHCWSGARLLDLRPLQFTGDISYALYLWHWPLIVLLPYARNQPTGELARWAILGLTFVLATLSTRLVEDPIRTGRIRLLRKPTVTFAFVLLGALALVVPSAAVWRGQLNVEAQAQVFADSVAAKPPKCFGAAAQDPKKPCHNPNLDTMMVPNPRSAIRDRRTVDPACASHEVGEPVVPCRVGNWDDPTIPKVALIGDSHARMFTGAFARLAEQGHLAYDGYFQSGCVWSTKPTSAVQFADQCVAFKDQLRTILTDQPDRYDFYVTTGRVSKMPGSAKKQAAGLVKEWRQVSDRGQAVVAITDAPEMGRAINDCLARVPSGSVPDCGVARDQALAKADPFARAAKKADHASVIDLADYYCGKQTCPAVIGGVTVYADGNHITATYAKTLAPILRRKLKRMDLLPD